MGSDHGLNSCWRRRDLLGCMREIQEVGLAEMPNEEFKLKIYMSVQLKQVESLYYPVPS